MASRAPLKILSLGKPPWPRLAIPNAVRDGGGIRGLSSLLILEDIMEKIRKIKQLDRIPRPCEYFDLIGGTSTGGHRYPVHPFFISTDHVCSIIAIMLGRLRMTVDECIRAYKKVAQQAFTLKRTSILPARPTGAFSAKALEAAIKQTIKEFCVEPQCVTRRSQGESTTEACPHSEKGFRDGSCTKTYVPNEI
jgi:hypothetical protein